MAEAIFKVILSDGRVAGIWRPRKSGSRLSLHVTLFADTSYDFVSYVHPTPNLGVFGFNLLGDSVRDALDPRVPLRARAAPSRARPRLFLGLRQDRLLL